MPYKKRSLDIWHTAGFSERSHRYYMSVVNSNSRCLKVMNRPFSWWGAYRYLFNPACQRAIGKR